MPYPFALPTTGAVLLSDYFDSVTHPSLPLAAATQRNVVRDALKQYKRVPAAGGEQASRLPGLQDALTTYLAHLLTIHAGLSYRTPPAGPLTLDVQIRRQPLTVSWRSSLAAPPAVSAVLVPGNRETPRVRVHGLPAEITLALTTLAHTRTLLARAALQPLPSLSGDARTAAIQAAMKHLFAAQAIHAHTVTVLAGAGAATTSHPSSSISASALPPGNPRGSSSAAVPIPDLHPPVCAALAALALADATLIAAAKDDPYAAAVADERNARNTDWMYRAPRIEAARASALARLCVRAAEYAAEAVAGLGSRSGGGSVAHVDDALSKYARDLRRTARARAARFLAVQAEMDGRIGEGLAWLQGARKELGWSAGMGSGGTGGSGARKGLKGLKQSWKELREDRRVEKGGEWGLDAGRLEEARVVEMLEAKWERENSIMNVQLVPPFEPLLATLPSGRTPFVPPPFVPPALDAETLAGMRAPPDPDEAVFRGEEDDSDGQDGFLTAPVGTFPGMEGEYGRSTPSSTYY